MINYVSVNATTEKPLVVLRPKRKYFWAFIIILIVASIYLLFGALIPFIKTGDYSEVWASDRHKRKLVFAALLLFSSLPFAVPSLKIGNSRFYNDRMEYKPFLGRKTIVVPYSQMHVWSYNRKMIINLQSVPGWVHPIQRIKVRYLNALCISTTNASVENPEDLPKTIQIIKEKAFVFLEKKTTLIS